MYNFFTEIAVYESVAKKNLYTLIVLISMYIVTFIIQLANVTSLYKKPLTYVGVVWIQHLLFVAFWVVIYLIFKKFTIYSIKIREVSNKFMQEEKCDIIFHQSVNVVEFNFSQSRL